MTPMPIVIIVIIGAAIGPLAAWMASAYPRRENADSLMVASALGVFGALVAGLCAQALVPEPHAALIGIVCASGAALSSIMRRRWVVTA